VTVETCPHYLNFVSEEVPRGDTSYKCAPPLRGSANREAIWQGLMDGIVDSVASDHSPSPLDMKKLAEGDFSLAWGGIAGVNPPPPPHHHPTPPT
jgi:allantoinase